MKKIIKCGTVKSRRIRKAAWEKLVELMRNKPRVKPPEGVICGTEVYSIDATVDYLISHGVTVQEWISVDDRLPDDNDRVIAFRQNEPETSAYKYCVMWGWSVKASLKHRGITHWQYLPQPPKGE